MIRILVLTFLAIALTGCSIFGRTKPVEVVTTEIERERLNLEVPEPIKLPFADWILITPENAEEVWKELQDDNKHLVLFAITSEGYEELSLTMAEIRNYIATQRLIIARYQEYYEPKTQSNEQ